MDIYLTLYLIMVIPATVVAAVLFRFILVHDRDFEVCVMAGLVSLCFGATWPVWIVFLPIALVLYLIGRIGSRPEYGVEEVALEVEAGEESVKKSDPPPVLFRTRSL